MRLQNVGAFLFPHMLIYQKGCLNNLKGSPLKLVLENANIYAMELRDSNYQKPQLYINEEVTSGLKLRGLMYTISAAMIRHLARFTWVKMDEPSIEGLKLALQDGDVSVNRNMSDNSQQTSALTL